MSRPTFILLGSCRADVLAQALRRIPVLADRFEIHYFRSYKHPIFGWESPDPDLFRRCAILWEELGQWESFPYKEALQAGAQVLTFPSVDFTCLWPHRCRDPLNRPEPPALPDGPFPYGDARVIELMKASGDPEATLKVIQKLDQGFEKRLDRLFELESFRILANDAKCTIPFGGFILDTFTQVRTHYTYNHPTPFLFHALLLQLVQATDFGGDIPFQAVYRPLRTLFDDWDPLPYYRIPVHPQVAEHFSLQWYSPSIGYGHTPEESLPFDDYYRRYIAWRLQRG